MKTDTKTEFFEELIVASNCNDIDLMNAVFRDRFVEYDDLGRKYIEHNTYFEFAVDLIDYLKEAHSDDPLKALVVTRRILRQLSE